MTKVSNHDWKNRPLDVGFLLDSGLLFEINRSILHVVGVALTVRKDEQGKLSLALKDGRAEPEKMLLDSDTFESGKKKLRRFMEEFGYAQDTRRINKLGKGVQC